MSQDANLVNLYLIDKETGRKLLFKINPLMLGKPENLTLLFPNGIEYKLTETELSDAVVISQFYERFDNISKLAADHFPKYGYKGEDTPKLEELKTAMRKETVAFFERIADGEMMDEDIQKIERFKVRWDDPDFKETIEEISVQKLSQWVMDNRTIEEMKSDMKTRQLSSCYTKDYVLRFTKVFKELSEAAADPNTSLTFMEAINKISTELADMQNDFRSTIGMDWIREIINYYEPVQVMFKPTIDSIVGRHTKGTNIKINEEAEGDDNFAAITKGFWDQFRQAMKSCYDAILKKQRDLDQMIDLNNTIGDQKSFDKDILSKIRSSFAEYKTAYKDFNVEMSKASAENKEIDPKALTSDMYRKNMGKLIRTLDQILIRVSLYYNGDENLIKGNDLNEIFFTVCQGIPMSMQGMPNMSQALSGVYNLIEQFELQLQKVEKAANL